MCLRKLKKNCQLRKDGLSQEFRLSFFIASLQTPPPPTHSRVSDSNFGTSNDDISSLCGLKGERGKSILQMMTF